MKTVQALYKDSFAQWSFDNALKSVYTLGNNNANTDKSDIKFNFDLILNFIIQ